MKFTVENDIFNYFPNIKFVTIVAKDMDKKINKEKIEQILKDGWKNASIAATAYENPQSHPNILPWVNRMKEVGAPRKHFPSSIESMVRRAGKNPEPFHINPIVDFYNGISLKYLTPLGGYDIDELENDLTLRLSKAGDTFMSLDSNENIEIPSGEVSYTDGNIIITRHFVWKQSKHALLTEKSKNIFLVSEILNELPEDTVNIVGEALKSGIKDCFDVEAKLVIVDVNNNSIEIM